MLVQKDHDRDASVARSIACGEMPELIVRHFLRDLPDPLRRDVDSHLSSCPRCLGRRQALAIAAGHHETRRRCGLTGSTSGDVAS